MSLRFVDDGAEKFTFDDVLIVPEFSSIKSRKLVNLTTHIPNMELSLPVISSNMDTITGPEMCKVMTKNGGVGCLHRFWSVEENIQAFVDADRNAIVSIGLGEFEFYRAKSLISAGAKTVCVDVANGASQESALQVSKLMKSYPEVGLVVGNFGSKDQVKTFLEELMFGLDVNYSQVYYGKLSLKVGIGGGSVCTTRVKTGVGYPQLSAIAECKEVFPYIIADGGIRSAGDVAKALAAGAHAVMIGGMLAGTDETPGDVLDLKTMSYADNVHKNSFSKECVKKYRGSASKESYDVQEKDAAWRTAEGESVLVPYKGSAQEVLDDIAGGLRSSFSYVGADTLSLFHALSRFVRVSQSTKTENGAHINRL